MHHSTWHERCIGMDEVSNRCGTNTLSALTSILLIENQKRYQYIYIYITMM